MKRVSASFDRSGIVFDANFEQQIRSLLAELGVLTSEEFLVRPCPCQRRNDWLFSKASPVCLTSAPAISKLFFRVRLDHCQGIEVTIGQCLRGFRVLAQELRRAAKGVHHHRVSSVVAMILPLSARCAHPENRAHRSSRRRCRHCRPGCGSGLRLEIDDLDVFHREAVFLQHPRQRKIGRGARRAPRRRFCP